MSLSCQFEQLASSYSLGELTRDIFIDTKLQLPDSSAKIGAIIGGNYQTGSPVITVNDNSLIVSGLVYPQLIYLASELNDLSEHHHHEHHDHHDHHDDHDDQNEDNNNYSSREPKEHSYMWLGDNGINYEERIEIPGLQANAIVEVKVIPKSCDFERNGADRVNFVAKILLVIQPANLRQNTIISDLLVQPLEKINVTKEQITTEELNTIKSAIVPVQASLMLPNLKPGISRIIKCGVLPSSLSWEYNRGKIYLKGLLDVNLIYVGCDDDDLPTEIMINEWNRESDNAIPFETYFETEVPEEGIIVIPNVAPADTRIEIKSHREMRCQINLDCRVTISCTRSVLVVTEAMPGSGTIIDTQTRLLNFEEYLGEANGEISFELSVDLPAGQPGIERLLNYQGQFMEPRVEVTEGHAALENNLDLCLLYMADDSDRPRLFMARWESRYNNSLPIAGMIEFPNLQPGSSMRIQMMLESLKLEPVNERTIKISGQVKVRILARNSRTLLILEDCAEVIPVSPEIRPSMLFYIVQPGDTLWKIARRYQTTVAQLVRTNQISNPDRIDIGQKLLIPKMITG